MTLPLLVSWPHAGLAVPREAQSWGDLTPDPVAAGVDESARAIAVLRPLRPGRFSREAL